jgi:hypothetical protein
MNWAIAKDLQFKNAHTAKSKNIAKSRGTPGPEIFLFFSFCATFSLDHTGLYETQHPCPKKLSFLFLGLEGWDQHHCNPLAKLLLVHVTRVLWLAPAGNSRACLGSRSTPSACTSCHTGCVAQLFFKKIGPGVPPKASTFVGLAVYS